MNKPAQLVKQNEYPMGLSESLASKLETWEDHVSYYVQLSEASNSFSWIKADILLHLANKFGESSIKKISNDIGEPASTVASYVRVSRAFPRESRYQNLSFSHHFQASFADSYDESKGEFITDDRFGWIERASDENLSTRRIRAEIQEEKEDKNKDASIVPTCDFCKIEGHTVQKYVFFCPTQRGVSVKKMLHPDCFQDVIDFIENNDKIL